MEKYTHKKNYQFINEVADFFGGVPKMADALGIDRHAIYQWKKIPISRAFQIEVLTNGKFKAAHILRLNQQGN